MIILTDVDDTVLEWSDAFQQWAKANGYETTGVLRETHSAEHMLGLTRSETSEIITKFNHSGALISQAPEPDAMAVLPDLYRDGWKFVAITACGLDETFRTQRKATLETVFGFPWEVYTVELHDTKRGVLKSFDPAIWVEDNLWHATEGAAIGHQTYLLDRHYNQNSDDVYPAFTRAASWHEIASQL